MAKKRVDNYSKFNDYKSKKRYGVCYENPYTKETVTYTTDDIVSALRTYNFLKVISLVIYDRLTNEFIKLEAAKDETE